MLPGAQVVGVELLLYNLYGWCYGCDHSVLCALIGGHLRAIKWCQTCSQLMLARPDVREIMMRETTLLGLAQFKRHPKQLVFKYVIFHTSRARWAMRSVPRTADSIRCKAFITTVATAMCKGRSMVNTFLSIARAFQTGDVLEIETRTNYFFNGSACSCAPVRPPPCHHCVDTVHPCIYK